MTLYFIRHAMTAGNLMRRYVGRTDEGLCDLGKAALRALSLPPVSRLYASPMRRCIETARILCPNQSPILVPDFRECDFGDFEYKNAAELAGDPRYQAFIDSGGHAPFPGGESRAEFSSRCVRAFLETVQPASGDAALFVHGGTIMAIFEALQIPKTEYFSNQVKPGEMRAMRWDGSALTPLRSRASNPGICF